MDANGPTIKRLSDGVVTLAEYDAAMADSIACYEAHDLVVSQPYVNRLDGWRRMWTVSADSAKISMAQQQQIVGDCDAQFNTLVTLGYQLRHLDRIDALVLQRSRSCFKTNELDIPLTAVALREVEAAGGGEQRLARQCLLAASSALHPKEDVAVVDD